MKKILALLTSIVILLCILAACGEAATGGGSEIEEKVAAQQLADTMAEILDGVDDLPMPMETELTAEQFPAYLFIDYIEGAEALASDAAIGAIAHSVCLLKLPEGKDAAAVAKDIEENADARKWICVEAKKVVVSQHGRLILLVMSKEAAADAISTNFDALFV